jgi:tetratricopeptide (TPR) repeat protein
LIQVSGFRLYGIIIVLILIADWNAAPACAQNDSTEVDRAFHRLYNFDFTGAHSIIDAHIQSNPDDPLGYSLRGAVFLFTELHRLQILDIDFFSDDDKVTDKKRLKPDPTARLNIFSATAEARRKAAAQLVQRPEDRTALFAQCMASGLEAEYSGLVEKKYLRSCSLAKENQSHARRLLALNPPFYDAYVTLGSTEYLVANLNFIFRLFVRFENIKGNRQKAIENLKLAIDQGRYYQPYAKILLTVVYLREKRVDDALTIMKELERDFPENPLFKKEAALLAEKAATKKLPGKSR